MKDEHCSAIRDTEIRVVTDRYPSETRDFVICKQIPNGVQQLNPIELLGTDMAVRLLKFTARTGDEDIARQNTLSRLLTQCLEYQGNRRHLICEPWTEDDLRGDTMFENNRTEFARDCGVEQAHRFQVVMSGEQDSELPSEELYWGSFTTLPQVEDTFTDASLQSFADQLQQMMMGNGDSPVTLDVMQMRRNVKTAWDNQFKEFDLDVAIRDRRHLFKRLMSVSIRQTSNLTQRIAFAFVLKNLGSTALQRDRSTFSEREQKLFDLRYGNCEALGRINIGFLYEYGELHAELINQFANSLISDKPEVAWQQAETNLRRHVQLLGELRDLRRFVRADQRKSTRDRGTRKLPRPRIDAGSGEEADARAAAPDDKLLEIEMLNELKRVVNRLKPRDRKRAQALIDSGGDRGLAAESLGLTRRSFNDQFRQTVRPNLKKEIRKLKREEKQ
ncbi:hypothetical protein Pla100_24350 [Neorhodopirellula pilleata]|uniref:Uncharacterized protein n=2 Tax=Neorhodopirellula pilleata TaxID=2714738 RepID=A0A5C6ADN7_9BACT|nr:hypothetical protein Pla100_24350 [Neorhodopirellula pilleata]